METAMGAVCVSLMMIAALYGLTQLVGQLEERVIRPRCDRSMLVLCLDDTMTDAEHQIRWAQHTAMRTNTPLYVLDRTNDEELRRIAQWLLEDGVGELVCEIPLKKMPATSCDTAADCV